MTIGNRVLGEPEVVGVFDAPEALTKAIDELRMLGFSQASICVLAHERTVEEKLHKRFWSAKDLEDDPEAPRATYYSEEDVGVVEGALVSAPLYVLAVLTAGLLVTPGGAALPLVAGASLAGGAGAGLGALLAWIVGHRHAEHLKEQIRHGGMLLWVRAPDRHRQEQAVETLKACDARDVHMHGWSAIT